VRREESGASPAVRAFGLWSRGQPQSNVAASAVDVRPLRVEANVTDHFCPLCDCLKSGDATRANPIAESCISLTCPCRDWSLRSHGEEA
jgi:hypothetical protein